MNRFFHWIIFALFAMTSLSQANTLSSHIGDREVTFKLVQKNNKTLLETASNEIQRPPLVLNAANKKFFVEALKKACNKTELEVNTYRYQIEINREENGKKIRCVYGFNSTSPKAAVARNALDVLAIAVNTAAVRDPAAK